MVGATELEGAPQIIATQEDRVAIGSGNTAYAEKVGQQDTRWQVFRRGDPLIDPETKETLGYVATIWGKRSS